MECQLRASAHAGLDRPIEAAARADLHVLLDHHISDRVDANQFGIEAFNLRSAYFDLRPPGMGDHAGSADRHWDG